MSAQKKELEVVVVATPPDESKPRLLTQSDIDLLALNVARLCDRMQALSDALGLSDMHLTDELHPVKRRRSEDELRRALAMLVSGQRRAPNDESEQILQDCINELFALRNLSVSFMQSGADTQKRCMMAIRAITGQ